MLAGSASHAREGEAVYWALFRRPIPSILAQRYQRAALEMDRSAPSGELAALARLVAGRADLEAAELAARLTGRLPLLTRKLALMAYLAETLPDHQRYFVARRSNLPGALAALAWSAALTVVKALRGVWLLRSVRRG
jgi:hypothetical protein